MTLKFNTCLILVKNVESFVNSDTNTWKNLYGLHEPRIETIVIKDIEDDSDEQDEEATTETIQFDTIEVEEGIEEGTTKEAKQDEEEDDLVQIVAKVIASLHHSPDKIATSNSETTTASVIVTTPSVTSNVQSPLISS